VTQDQAERPTACTLRVSKRFTCGAFRGKRLVSYASLVDSGIAEVVRKQEAGWSYIRSGL
jgi:intracellular sulfur oxidation DsrE/DsrF family protein